MLICMYSYLDAGVPLLAVAIPHHPAERGAACRGNSRSLKGELQRLLTESGINSRDPDVIYVPERFTGRCPAFWASVMACASARACDACSAASASLIASSSLGKLKPRRRLTPAIGSVSTLHICRAATSHARAAPTWYGGRVRRSARRALLCGADTWQWLIRHVAVVVVCVPRQ